MTCSRCGLNSWDTGEPCTWCRRDAGIKRATAVGWIVIGMLVGFVAIAVMVGR